MVFNGGKAREMLIAPWIWFTSLLTGQASLPFLSSQFLRDGLWGLMIVDALHAVLDLLVSAAKRAFKKTPKPKKPRPI